MSHDSIFGFAIYGSCISIVLMHQVVFGETKIT